jgi:diguanylate cyclase (GGDEF)-like protein/PAS domain S-box-containing protein
MESVLTQGTSRAALHPMNSSQNFLGLLGLCEVGNHPDPEVRLSLLGRMLSAIRFRDDSIFFHSRRVAIISVGISQRLGWSSEEVQHLEIASLLHDFGKVGVPDHILQKPGKLNADERELIRTAHDVAEILFQASRFTPTTLDIFRDTQSLSGDGGGHLGRHLGARILTVADAFDSLTHDQAHRRALSREEAMQHLQNTEGAKFDRNVVAALQRWLASEEVQQLDQASEVERALRDHHQIDADAVEQASRLCHLFSHLTLLESLYDAYYLIDADHRIVIWSRGAEKLFGQKRSDVMGTPWSRSIVDYSVKGMNDSVMHVAIQRLRSFMVTAKVKTKQGELDAEVQAIPFWDDRSVFRGACEIIHRQNSSRRGSERYQELQMAATRDPLTGLANRAELESRLAKIYEESQHPGATPFSAIFLDIDHFKSINDENSHQVGDQVLVDVAHLIEDELYSGELVARYGGEEFVVICPETALAEAVQRADRLRRTVQSASPGTLKITASFGVAQWEEGDSIDDVLRRADAAMYDAKQAGRNRTCQRIRKEGSEESTIKPEAQAEANPYVMQAAFNTTVAANMITQKLAGFVDAHRAKVWDVTPDGFQMSVGETTLFGGWGSVPDKQPVQIAVAIGAVDKTRRTNRVEIKIQITPLGRKPAVKVFQERSIRMRDEIRAYCLADQQTAD